MRFFLKPSISLPKSIQAYVNECGRPGGRVCYCFRLTAPPPSQHTHFQIQKAKEVWRVTPDVPRFVFKQQHPLLIFQLGFLYQLFCFLSHLVFYSFLCPFTETPLYPLPFLNSLALSSCLSVALFLFCVSNLFEFFFSLSCSTFLPPLSFISTLYSHQCHSNSTVH